MVEGVNIREEQEDYRPEDEKYWEKEPAVVYSFLPSAVAKANFVSSGRGSGRS